MKNFNELVKLAAKHGFRLVMEDKNLTDSTQVYALYKSNQRICRYGSIKGVNEAFVHLIEQESE